MRKTAPCVICGITYRLTPSLCSTKCRVDIIKEEQVLFNFDVAIANDGGIWFTTVTDEQRNLFREHGLESCAEGIISSIKLSIML